MRISNSEIQTFKRCKRKWWFNYYLRLKPALEVYTGPSSIGNRVHSALEQYYNMLYYGETTENAIGDSLGTHDSDVSHVIAERGWQDGDPDLKKFESEAELTRLMLEGYFEWLQETGADEGLEVVSVERPVTWAIDDDIEIMGKLDVRVYRQHDGATLGIDHKTTQSLEVPVRTLHMNEQELMYEWLLHKVTYGARVDGSLWNFLRKCKRTASAKRRKARGQRCGTAGAPARHAAGAQIEAARARGEAQSRGNRHVAACPKGRVAGACK